MEIIRFESMSFAYAGCDQPALRELSFGIKPSEFIVVCGRSGCGKSTLLRHMKRELAPDGDREGQVLYNGTDVEELAKRVSAAEIGFVHQNPERQIVTDKVWHELAFGLESLGYSSKIIRRRVAEMASFFGIQTWFRKSVFELSGGQKQLLNLASVMAMQPKVLILDEPTSQLDPIASSEFLETLAKINRELGTTIILSEHRLEEAFPLADRVLVMEQGELLTFDTPEQVGRRLGAEGERHPMFLGLPTAMKVYAGVRPEGSCPITVREGRTWLSEQLGPSPRVTSLPSPAEQREKRENAIELKDVWFRYDRDEEDVVRDLSLQVARGDLFCLIGGNGVGKTTTLKLISGARKPYRGKVLIGGKEIKKYSNQELFTHNLGMLPQNPQALFTEAAVEEELYEMLSYAKLSDKERLARVDEMLEFLGLTDLRKMHPYDLSGGEQQRLALGKVLLLEPKILLLDEPTKGLDPFFKTVLAELFAELKSQGVTILMVTHDIEFCAEYADECAMFFDGSVVSQDTPRVFFSGNSFYTTAANRMSRHLFDNAVTYKDVISLCEQNLTPLLLQKHGKSEPSSLRSSSSS